MNKSARKKWLEKMADKAEDEGTKQAELDDVLDDYGLVESYTDLHGPGEIGTTTSDTDKDYGLHPFSDPKYVPAYTDKSFQTTPDMTGIGKNSKPTMSGTPKKAKGKATAAKKPMPIDPEKGQEEPDTGTKSGTPNKAKGKATAAKISPKVTVKAGVATQEETEQKIDEYAGTKRRLKMRKKAGWGEDTDKDSVDGPGKGLKHKCPTHVKKEGYGYGVNISHTLTENIVDKMNIYWFDSKEISYMMPTSEVEIVSEGHHDQYNHREKFKSTKKIAEGYMILPAIDRERYTEMRGLEGPFMTRSGKVVYYDPKAGEYYDRDSDMYLSYDEYMSLDQETSAQKAAMKQGVFADPKSIEFKKMMKDKAKAEKKAKKQQVRSESLGMTFARKFYKREVDNGNT